VHHKNKPVFGEQKQPSIYMDGKTNAMNLTTKRAAEMPRNSEHNNIALAILQ